MPLLHQPDAHSEFAVQGFPSTGFAPSGWQTPPPTPSGTHFWLQQSLSKPHARLSATHCMLEQVVPAHEPVQHWFPVVHDAPGNSQRVDGLPHLPLAASQFALQHSVLFAHVSASGLHVAASARLPSIVSMKPSVAASSVLVSELLPPSSPPSCVASTSDSLPQPAKATAVAAVAETKQSAAHGSFCMTAILPRRARAWSVDANDDGEHDLRRTSRKRRCDSLHPFCRSAAQNARGTTRVFRSRPIDIA
jgi:hypothetical protein